MERIKVIGSSNVASIGHEGDVMEVEYLDGTVYQYSPVGIKECEKIRNAPSVGACLRGDMRALGVRGVKQN